MRRKYKSADNSNSGGVGFIGAMALLFIALKLTGYLDWSWWWVLAPIWVSVSLFGLAMLITLLVVLKRG